MRTACRRCADPRVSPGYTQRRLNLKLPSVRVARAKICDGITKIYVMRIMAYGEKPRRRLVRYQITDKVGTATLTRGHNYIPR